MQKSLKNNLLTFGLSGLAVIAVIGGLFALGAYQDRESSSKGAVSEVSLDENILGKTDSLVTLIEYSDFQCPTCAAFAPIVDGLMERYGDEIRLVYRHFPIYNKHLNAENAAKAAEAAGEQGKFFEYASLLFEEQTLWSELSDPKEKFAEYAETIGLDKNQFLADYENKAIRQKIRDDYQSGLKAGVNGTPTFFLNGQDIGLPRNLEAFSKLIDEAITATKPVPNTEEIKTSDE